MTDDTNKPSNIASTPEEFYARIPEQDRTIVQGFVDSMKGLDAVVYACGSTVTGTQHKGSDIDLLVDVRPVLPNSEMKGKPTLERAYKRLQVEHAQSVTKGYLTTQNVEAEHPLLDIPMGAVRYCNTTLTKQEKYNQSTLGLLEGGIENTHQLTGTLPSGIELHLSFTENEPFDLKPTTPNVRL